MQGLMDVKIDLILLAALYPWGRFSLWQKWVKVCLLEGRGGWCLALKKLIKFTCQLSHVCWTVHHCDR